MKIAIIGGGFTGLTAAYKLSRAGHRVTVFEKESFLGGLAYGFRSPNWQWFIEGAYHHLFTNDTAILSLLNELGLHQNIIVKRPVTASLWNDKMYQLDSPLSLLLFPGLPFIDKVRTALLLGMLKLTPFWKPLESITAERLIRMVGGEQGWHVIWEPLLYGKFGDLAPTVSAAWFWARIKKRTASLCYIAGGFHTLINALEKSITQNGGTIVTGKIVSSLPKKFDRVLLTVPAPLAKKLAPGIKSPSVPHLHAQTLILETDKPILKNVYWLNVTDRSFPFLAAVAHTNFMDPAHYSGHHLTYFGNYLPQGHPYLSLTKEQLLKKFLPYIKKIGNWKLEIVNLFMFTGPFAQPVHQLHYSQKIPPIKTSIPGVYLANMDSIVPWDRGTNYAVELGTRAAKIIHENT